MTAIATYSTGTATVGAGGTSVTGIGTIWSGVNVRPGDIFQIGNFQTVISDVVSTTGLTIPPWGGGAQTSVAYKIYQVSPQRFAGAQAMADVSTMVAALNTLGYFVFVSSTETVPDPSLGADGQFALQPSTQKMWNKSAGVWNLYGTFKGFGTPAAWNSGTAYVANDVATLNGSSYVCILAHTNQTPPNGTYWVLLASKGDTGATGPNVAKNYLLNPSGEIQQITLGSQADASYDFDQWLTLTQSNPITASSVADAENATPFMMRSLQANASAQRFGRIQWLEKLFCRDLRGQPVTLSARVRMSASTTLRYAIVEWTGTADAITKDVVNNWASGTFTTGNFFTSTTTTVVGTGSIALTANTLTDITALTGTVSASMNNLAVIFWTDSTQAQNVTLDIAKVKLEKGSAATVFEPPNYADEMRRCLRYFERIFPAVTSRTVAIGGFESTSRLNAFATWKIEKRIIPTVTFSTASDWTVRQNSGGVTATASSLSPATAAVTVNGVFTDCNVATTPFTAGQFGCLVTANTSANYTVDARL